MPEVTEGKYAGEFIVSEANGSRSRSVVTVKTGRTLTAAMVVSKFTADSKLAQLNPAGIDGSAAAVGILYGDVDAATSDAPGVIIDGNAEVNAAELTWPVGILLAEKNTAIAELLALDIKVR